jgi:hypothetical protein
MFFWHPADLKNFKYSFCCFTDDEAVFFVEEKLLSCGSKTQIVIKGILS